MIPYAALALLALQGATPPANPAPPTNPAPDAVVATIDGKPLTAAEVEPYLWAWKSREVINLLAIHKAVAAEAARKGVAITDAEAKAKLDEQLATTKAGLRPNQTMDDALAGVGGVSGLALAIRSSLLLERIAEKDFTPDGYAKMSMILFRPAGDAPTPATTAAASKSADAAYAALQAGKAWDAVEKANEKEPRLLQSGGLIGWTSVDALPEGARAQVAALKPMGYTKPVQTPGGLAIFRLMVRGKDAPAADVATLKSQYVTASRQSLVAKIRSATKIEIKG